MLDILIIIIIIVILGIFYFCRTTENMDYTNDRFERPTNIMDDNNDNNIDYDTSNVDNLDRNVLNLQKSDYLSSVLIPFRGLYNWLSNYNSFYGYGSPYAYSYYDDQNYYDPYYYDASIQSTFRHNSHFNRNKYNDSPNFRR